MNKAIQIKDLLYELDLRGYKDRNFISIRELREIIKKMEVGKNEEI